ncbi:hypothetical protein [Aeropyrum camini]|uniref:hypothetical protein n=1 Tax=Aeropyrum camini TaxID=229980 RepID=UPI000787F24F|nr:hypothetical protein [Aeropyrum camini]
MAEARGFATSFTLGPGTLASRLTALALGAPLVFGSHPQAPLEGVPPSPEILGMYLKMGLGGS